MSVVGCWLQPRAGSVPLNPILPEPLFLKYFVDCVCDRFVCRQAPASVCNAGGPSLIPVLGRSLGEGIGYPLQYFCLGNPMNRGAWWVTVHGVARKSDIPAWENHLQVGICIIRSHLPILNFITDSLSLVSETVSAAKAFCSVNGGFYFQFQGFCLCNLQFQYIAPLKALPIIKKKRVRQD